MTESSEPAKCIRCGGQEDLMDVAFAPGMTYCKPCRVARSVEDRVHQAERLAYDNGIRDALTAALRALDGHSFADTSHDRVRALRACGECDHQPEQHHPDEGWCQALASFPGRGEPCPCAEYEQKALPEQAEASPTPSPSVTDAGETYGAVTGGNGRSPLGES